VSDDKSENMQAILDHVKDFAIEREEKASHDLVMATEDSRLIANILDHRKPVYMMIIRSRSKVDGGLWAIHEVSSSLKGLVRWAVKQYKKSGFRAETAPTPKTIGVNIITKPFQDIEKKNVGTLFSIPYELWSKEAGLLTDDDWKRLF